jgi:hypothetical protein
MQFVRLVNKDSRPFDFHQNQVKRILGPGDEAMVPWDIATSLFGDPYAVDTTNDQSRTRALKQSRGQFGYQLGGMTEEEWQEIRPKIEVYDVESGERIYMVLEDPQGVHGLPGAPAEVDGLANANLSTIEAQLAATQRQVELLTAILLKTQADEAPQGQSVVASEDSSGDDGKGSALPEATPSEDAPQAAPTGRKGKGASHLAPPPDLS